MTSATLSDGASRRRSCLTVPGASEKMLAKAAGLGADEIVFDLEDAVATAEKDTARERVAATLGSDAWAGRTAAVRVNAIGSPWAHTDIIAMAGIGAGRISLVIPKVESPDDLAFIDRLLAGIEAATGASRPTRIQALIETAKGLANVQAIAGASPRLEALILGYADLASSLGRASPSTQGWRSAQDAVVLAARANGVQAIDGPYFRIQADDQLTADCRAAADLGFDGKWAIHPSHLAVINDAFTPSADDVAKARALVTELEAARREGRGAVAHGGGMIDEAMRAGALRILARAGDH